MNNHLKQTEATMAISLFSRLDFTRKNETFGYKGNGADIVLELVYFLTDLLCAEALFSVCTSAVKV